MNIKFFYHKDGWILSKVSQLEYIQSLINFSLFN